MKTKIFIALCSLFMLSSLVSNAHSNISCDGNGGCWYTTYHYDNIGNPVWETHEYVGYGCVGGWCTEIDFVVPSGPPTHPQLNSDNYNSLASFVSSGLTSLTPDQSAALTALWTSNPSVHAWASPYLLTGDAYKAIYDGLPYYDIFYVYTSVDVSTSEHMINLYSDDSKTCHLVYKNISGTTVATENIGVAKGSNYVKLGAAHSLPSGYYTVKVSTSRSDVSVSLSM